MRFQNGPIYTWGLKTVAVLFPSDAREHAVELTLQIMKSARFIVVVFDSRLTWRQHIEYVTDRCQKRLNLADASDVGIALRS
jgi:hypothetical protein